MGKEKEDEEEEGEGRERGGEWARRKKMRKRRKEKENEDKDEEFYKKSSWQKMSYQLQICKIGINLDLFFRICQAMGDTAEDFFTSVDHTSRHTTMSYLGTLASGKP